MWVVEFTAQITALKRLFVTLIGGLNEHGVCAFCAGQLPLVIDAELAARPIAAAALIPERGRVLGGRLVIAVLSALLALGMVVAVPLSLDGGAGDVARLRNLEQGREALKDARAFRADEEQVTSLGEQLAQAGQLAADATDEDKLRAAEKMVDDQIAQMEAQLKTVEAGQARESQQRFIGGTITAVVLAIAFVLLAFTAVL